jgi:hypothetical protein
LRFLAGKKTMKASSSYLLAGLGVCLTLAGCQLAPARTSCTATAEDSPPSSLAITQRTRIEPEAKSLPVTAPACPTSNPAQYRALTAQRCQCLAVRNAGLANMLDEERQGVAKQTGQHSHNQAAELKQDILLQSAVEVRNRSSAAALELYFHLAEAEAKSDLLVSSLKTIGDAVERSKDLKKKGLKVPVDPDTLVRQQLDLKIDQARLEIAIAQLNAELKKAIGVEGCTDDRLWPAGDFGVSGAAVDVDAAVAEGLAKRPDLVLLREVNQKLNAQTLPVVRQFAQATSPLLGMAAKSQCVPLLACLLTHLPCIGASELEVRRQQIREQLAERERAAAQEIRQAALTLGCQAQIVVLANQQTQSLQAKVQEMEDKSKQGLASFLEVSQAYLDWYRARSALVKEVMAWHIARVQLKKAQGILPAECEDDGCASPGACLVN